ncbi:hypothetical protein ACIA8O_03045 [Kitasatospora sp. NPDC051853]|uniref:hypothetical protein n=1 Tax=Kitasatospora sp. NPDC051853 TaxID=3364058 RepID=UPI00378B183C
MAELSGLVRAELARHDWAALRCRCRGTAEHVPELFEILLTAETARDAFGYSLDGHVECDTNIDECTPAAVGVILAALAGEVPPFVGHHFLATLSRVAAGWDTAGPAVPGRVGDDCRAAVREGLWPLLQRGLGGTADDAETVADIIEWFGLDDERSVYYQDLLRARVVARTKRRTPKW